MVHKKKRKQPPADSEADTEIKEEPGNKDYVPSAKRARIIIRNLPFENLSEKMVKDLLDQYGKIVDVNLLRKKNRQFVGCGFVEFDSRMAAAKAIAQVNGKELNGRPVILDWALPKHTYVNKMAPAEPEIKEEPLSDEEDDKEGILEDSVDTKPEVEGDSEENEDDEEDEDDDDDDDGDDFDDEEEEDEEMEVEEVPKKKQSNDVDEGRTVFIKNIPFSARNEDVKASMTPYGDVVYALVCVDKLTEHSKGTAFVKFKEKDGADKCIKDSNILTIKEQPVEVSKAVSREKLEEEKKQKRLKTKDSRNLYLVREGVVMAGSAAAATVSPADMAKRLQIEQWKTQILRNLNMFVSRTRIVVHNLPSHYDDAKFRALIERFTAPGVVVKEARVMHNRKSFDGKGNPISKELGFASFINHEDALHVLRSINNNPDIFTPSKRPIVSFSVENREILNLKQKRMEKSKVKNMGDKDKTKGKLATLTKQQRRLIKRKEKMIKLRQEAKLAKKEGRPVETKPKNGVVKSKAKGNQDGEAKTKKNVTGKPKSKKIGKELQNKKPNKAATSGGDAETDYSGTVSVPGKKMKMRSKLKLKKQVEIHKNRLKEVKKIKKVQRAEQKKMENRKERDVTVKGKKKINRDDDRVFSKLISTYKNRIEKSTSASKWYDS